MKDTIGNEIRSYVIRSGRLSKLQKNAIKTFSASYIIPFSQELLDFKSIFGNDNPVVIEVGFGMGHATAEIAKQNNDINYIGIEVHTPGVGKLLSYIDIYKLSNLRIIQFDAVKVFRHMIPEGSLSGIHIFFPDPWPKKKHHKRRLIQEEFVKNIIPLLKKGGYIYAATDWENYSEQIIRVFDSFSELSDPGETNNSKIDWRPYTRFEKKGIAKNHTIRDIWVEKK